MLLPLLFVLLLPLAAQTATLGAVTTVQEVEAGTLLLRTDAGLAPAPSLLTEVEITVTGMIARARVAQSFHNPTEDWIEGVYVFPLPERSAVDALRMWVGQRVIEGEMQTRQQARATYTRAKAEGRKASLLEQERPNIFTSSVANIGPGEEIRIEIEYQEDLRYDQGRFSLRFPMVVGPRYIPGSTPIAGFSGTGWAHDTDQVPDAARITPPVVHPESGPINPVRLAVAIDAGFPLRRVHSSSHAIQVTEPQPERYAVVLAETVVPADADFVLEWEPKVGAAPGAALFHEERDGEHYALLMVMPPDTGEQETERLPRETIFVIDTSGSMHEASIRQAREALLLALDRLHVRDRFNVIRFNSLTQPLYPGTVPADPRAVEHAKRWVRSLEASGGTEMLPALNAALADPEEGSGVRQVIFITDGSVGNETALFSVIQANLGRSRLFTVGIGSAPNSHFMTKAAEFGRGTFTHIGSSGEVGAKMGELFRKLESPVLSDIEPSWDQRAAEAWPRRVPDLYLGEPVVVTARLPELAGNLVIEGKRGDAPWRVDFPLRGGARQSGIGRLWARRKVAALMDTLHDGADAAEVGEAVTALGLRHHLVTKYTSLVAVDVTPTAPVGVEPDTRALPTNLPRGWSHERVFGGASARRMPQTATPAALLMVLGTACITGASLLARRPRARPLRAQRPGGRA